MHKGIEQGRDVWEIREREKKIVIDALRARIDKGTQTQANV